MRGPRPRFGRAAECASLSPPLPQSSSTKMVTLAADLLEGDVAFGATVGFADRRTNLTETDEEQDRRAVGNQRRMDNEDTFRAEVIFLETPQGCLTSRRAIGRHLQSLASGMPR